MSRNLTRRRIKRELAERQKEKKREHEATRWSCKKLLIKYNLWKGGMDD